MLALSEVFNKTDLGFESEDFQGLLQLCIKNKIVGQIRYHVRTKDETGSQRFLEGNPVRTVKHTATPPGVHTHTSQQIPVVSQARPKQGTYTELPALGQKVDKRCTESANSICCKRQTMLGFLAKLRIDKGKYVMASVGMMR